MRDLAAFRTKEKHPDRKVVAEVFEPVRPPSCNKETITGLERDPAIPIEENASSPSHDVDLIPRMGLLGVFASRRVEFYGERAVSK